MIDFFVANQVTLEIIYIISAVLAALLVPYSNAIECKRLSSDKTQLKYHLTYGHIFKGIFAAIIPVINTFCVCLIVGCELQGFINNASHMHVFKEKGNDV